MVFACLLPGVAGSRWTRRVCLSVARGCRLAADSACLHGVPLLLAGVTESMPFASREYAVSIFLSAMSSDVKERRAGLASGPLDLVNMTSTVVGLVDNLKQMINTMSSLVEKQLPSLVEAHTTQFVTTAVRPLISQVHSALADLAKAGTSTVQQQQTVQKALVALEKAATAPSATAAALGGAPAPALKPALKTAVAPPDPVNDLGALHSPKPPTPPGTPVKKATRFGPVPTPPGGAPAQGFTAASVAAAMPVAPVCESRAEGARPRQVMDDLLMRESPKRHREHNPAKTRDGHETNDDPRRND